MMFGCKAIQSTESSSSPVPHDRTPPTGGTDLSYILLIVGLMACATHITYKWVKGDT